MNNKRIIYFQIFILLLINKYSQSDLKRSLNRLDIFINLFFCVSKEKKLLEIFDNFYATQNGPVEVNCCNYVSSDLEDSGFFEQYINSCLKFYREKDNNSIELDINKYQQEKDLDQNIIILIKKGLQFLEEKNIFTKDTKWLIEISCKYESQKQAREIAKRLSLSSVKIDINIMNNEKNYLESLNNGII